MLRSERSLMVCLDQWESHPLCLFHPNNVIVLRV